jgi:hypothetical protein
MGPLGVIPQPFRMASRSDGRRFRIGSHFEWMAISNGRPTRMEGGGIGLLGPLGVFQSYTEWKAIPKVKLFRSHSDRNDSVVIMSGM